MMEWQERTTLLLGEDKLARLIDKNVLVVGLGGVGAYAAEMLCRAGVGNLTIVDGDIVSPSNINRQLLATSETINKGKAHLMEDRLRSINPSISLVVIDEFIKDERTIEILEKGNFDYVVDAIDTFSPKLYLVFHAHRLRIPIISSMGAGGKVDPTKVEIADISKTYACTLARVMRKRLRILGLRKGVKTVFSTELTNKDAVVPVADEKHKKSILGTISYLPAIFGCMIASVVIQDLCKEEG